MKLNHNFVSRNSVLSCFHSYLLHRNQNVLVNCSISFIPLLIWAFHESLRFLHLLTHTDLRSVCNEMPVDDTQLLHPVSLGNHLLLSSSSVYTTNIFFFCFCFFLFWFCCINAVVCGASGPKISLSIFVQNKGWWDGDRGVGQGGIWDGGGSGHGGKGLVELDAMGEPGLTGQTLQDFATEWVSKIWL